MMKQSPLFCVRLLVAGLVVGSSLIANKGALGPISDAQSSAMTRGERLAKSACTDVKYIRSAAHGLSGFAAGCVQGFVSGQVIGGIQVGAGSTNGKAAKAPWWTQQAVAFGAGAVGDQVLNPIGHKVNQHLFAPSVICKGALRAGDKTAQMVGQAVGHFVSAGNYSMSGCVAGVNPVTAAALIYRTAKTLSVTGVKAQS